MSELVYKSLFKGSPADSSIWGFLLVQIIDIKATLFLYVISFSVRNPHHSLTIVHWIFLERNVVICH